MDTQIGIEQLQYTVWIDNHLDRIQIGYEQKSDLDRQSEQGYKLKTYYRYLLY